jgi:hypothetical protein
MNSNSVSVLVDYTIERDEVCITGRKSWKYERYTYITTEETLKVTDRMKDLDFGSIIILKWNYSNVIG